jgi:hypothetical protein
MCRFEVLVRPGRKHVWAVCVTAAVTACGPVGISEPGDRASSFDGGTAPPATDGASSADLPGCPEGEVCSPATPAGLLFSVRRPVAVSGHHEVLFRSASGTDVPDWHAVSSDTAVLEILDQGTRYNLSHAVRWVIVGGMAPGGAYLRIVDAHDPDVLFDRIFIHVATVDRVAVRPEGWFELPPDYTEQLALNGALDSVDLRATLYGADGAVVVDDGTRFIVPSERTALLAPGAQELQYEVEAAGRSWTGMLPVATGPDRLALLAPTGWQEWFEDTGLTMLPGLAVENRRCVVPYVGSVPLYGTRGTARTIARSGAVSDASLLIDGCVYLPVPFRGILEAEVEGLSAAFHVWITADGTDGASSTSSPLVDPTGGWSPGEGAAAHAP